MSELPPAPSPRPRRTRWILLGVVAALWAGAAGAVIVATRRDDDEAAGSFTPSTHADLTQLQYVIGALPEGFRQLDAVGADEAVHAVAREEPWKRVAELEARIRRLEAALAAGPGAPAP